LMAAAGRNFNIKVYERYATRWRNAKAASVITSSIPLGINFLVLASRIAKTTNKTAMITSARLRLDATVKTPGSVARINKAAAIEDVIKETLLPALRNPITPPTSKRMM